MTDLSHRDELDPLDAYVDGMLSPDERSQFQRRLEQDESLRADAQLASQIDQALKRLFAAPPIDERLMNRLRQEEPDNVRQTQHAQQTQNARQLPYALQAHNGKQPREKSAARAEVSSARRANAARRTPTIPIKVAEHPAAANKRRWLVAAAAVLVCVSAWSWVLFRKPAKEPLPPLYSLKTFTEVYEAKVASGFKPLWFCEDDHEFASTFQERQGQALLLGDLPDGIRMAGLDYLPTITKQTTALLARVHEHPVIVFVETAARIKEEPERPPAESGLNLFRKELDGLVLYEVTPLDVPLVIEHLYRAEVPKMASPAAL